MSMARHPRCSSLWIAQGLQVPSSGANVECVRAWRLGQVMTLGSHPTEGEKINILNLKRRK